MGCAIEAVPVRDLLGSPDIDAILDSGDIPIATRPHRTPGRTSRRSAAGNGGTKTGQPQKFIGVAPEATIIFASPSKTGGFPDDTILRSAKFIFDRGDFMGMPVALNLSLGGDFGPHDGTSLLEEELSAYRVGDDKPGHVIVVASGGYSAGLYQVEDIKPIGAHTQVRVGSHAPVRVPVLTPGGVNKGKVFVWITLREGDEVSVGLEGPDGTWIHPVGPGGDAGYSGDNDTSATVVNNEVNGLSALTSDTNGAVVAWSGQWPNGAFAITLEGHGDAQLWTVAAGDVAAVGSYFSHGMVEGTVATPASSPNLMAVDCIVNRSTWKTQKGVTIGPPDTVADDVCFFSEAGPTPTGVPKPEILAPGSYIAGAMSIDADPRFDKNSIFFGGDSCAETGDSNCFVVDEGYAVTTGTSMSAPHATGAVALLLTQDPNLTEARATEILQASARMPAGFAPYQAQLGPGTIDLSQALAVMGAEPTVAEPPSPSRSWWNVSTELVRPDPTFPVWGTVELRRADGTVAGGLGGQVHAHRGRQQDPLAADEGRARTLPLFDRGSQGDRRRDRPPRRAVRRRPDRRREGSPHCRRHMDQHGVSVADGGCSVAPGRSTQGLELVPMVALAAAVARVRHRRTRAES